MVRLYWYGLAVIYMAACASRDDPWAILGGSADQSLGVVLGGMAASGIAMALNTPERMEAAVYGILSMVFIHRGWSG